MKKKTGKRENKKDYTPFYMNRGLRHWVQSIVSINPKYVISISDIWPNGISESV